MKQSVKSRRAIECSLKNSGNDLRTAFPFGAGGLSGLYLIKSGSEAPKNFMQLDIKLPIQLHANQQRVHESPARFKVLKIGKRWGKSYWAGFEIIQMAFRNPGVYWYIAPTIGQAREIMWDFLKTAIPSEVILGNPLNTDLEINLNLFSRGYSKIKLKGTDNETSLRGVSLDGGIMDEAAYDQTKGYAWPNILRGQLAKSKGPFYFISSPHKDGKNWFTKLCEYAQMQERAGDGSWAYWHDTIYGNPMLEKDEVEAIKAGCTDDKWRLEYMAEESDYGGLLLSEFDYGRHVKEFEVPKAAIWVRGIDWGIAHPTTCVWLAIDMENEFVYLADEYYQTDKRIFESASLIKQMTGGRPIAWTVIDPSTAKRNSQTGLTDMWEFQRNGVPCIPGDNRDRGIDIMKMFFKKDKILVHPKCKNFIAEAKNYVYGEDEGDDVLDSLKYGLVRVHDTMFHGNLFPAERKLSAPAPNTFNFNDLTGQKTASSREMAWAFGED